MFQTLGLLVNFSYKIALEEHGDPESQTDDYPKEAEREGAPMR